MRIAFLGYSRFFNQSGNECPAGARRCVKASLLDPERAVADVRAAAAEADAVVVSVHWGDEYAQQPRPDDVALAHRLVEAGALIVLGHHPHVLQPVELYRRADGTTALIAYSLGNFVSNQSRNYVHAVTPGEVGGTRDGILLRAEIARRDYGRGITRVELTGAGWFPLWTENDTPDPSRRTANRRPAIRVVSLDRALAETRAELRAMPDPVPRDEQARYVALRQREELYVARRAAIAAAAGEDLQREAPLTALPAAPRAAPAAGASDAAPTPLSPAASRP
jgi:poly-gamma-glutamate synthesis protein (capsule biosynthesis protein)